MTVPTARLSAKGAAIGAIIGAHAVLAFSIFARPAGWLFMSLPLGSAAAAYGYLTTLALGAFALGGSILARALAYAADARRRRHSGAD